MTKGKSTSGHGQLWCSRRAEAAVQQASQLRASTPGAGRAPAPAASWAQGAHGGWPHAGTSPYYPSTTYTGQLE